MSDLDARWLTLETAVPADQVRARIDGALGAQRAWAKSRGRDPRSMGTIEPGRFVLRTSSTTKEFAVEGVIEPAEEGTRLVVNVAALRRRPYLQALAVALVILGGTVGAWLEHQTDPDWPETALAAMSMGLALVFGWVSDVSVTAAEASRVGERLQQVVDSAPSPRE